MSALLVATVGLLGGCGDAESDTFTSSPPETTATRAATVPSVDPPAEGTLLRWSEAPGECQVCGFSLDLDASGTATYEGYETASTVEFDVDELRSRLTSLDGRALVVGSDDCGREVDGNAPVLELATADGRTVTIDDCYDTIDRDHPLMQLVRAVLADARSAAGED